MGFSVVIPARYASTRLPGKPLRDIAGKTMIQRVYEQARSSDAEHVVVATDDKRIVDTVSAFGGEVCLTAEGHPSGTDRVQEVAEKLGFDGGHIVVNVQGDEPLIPPVVINQVADNLSRVSEAGVATLCEPIVSVQDFVSPDIVKVVLDQNSLARFFSRAPIPWPRDSFARGYPHALPEGLEVLRHIGIYAYRVSSLARFVQWPAAPTETVEALEQLRFLWHGESIHVDRAVAKVPGGVDTREDLKKIIRLLAG